MYEQRPTEEHEQDRTNLTLISRMAIQNSNNSIDTEMYRKLGKEVSDPLQATMVQLGQEWNKITK